MKQAQNNEMDLLLRSLARSETEGARRARLSGDDAEPVSPHLDADELNAFAEGVLPELARTRYTEHLADCGSCRRVVVSLTLAAGTAIRSPAKTEQGGTSFWRKVAAVFSQPVLRYAVPALALAAVIGISLLALRQQRSAEFIAQHQPGSSTTSGGEANLNLPVPGQSKAPTAETLRGASPTTESPASDRALKDDRDTLESRPASTVAPPVQPTKDSGLPDHDASVQEAKPWFAPEPQAPPPPPRQQPDESSKLAMEAQERQRNEYHTQTTGQAEGNRSAAAKSAPTAGRRVQGLMVEDKAAGTKNKRDSAGEDETRKVSGKQFRRQGNAWVDTAYDPSRGTINVRRASEQFRALIADEPGIGSIAEQLGGEVVLVWKGRAYRIR
jgi:hypothetical protein